MKNYKNENSAYTNFIQNLNEILNHFEINQLNCS